MDVSPQSYPDPSNPINCLCINPKCQQPQRHSNEKFCQSCGSDLLLKQRYRVLNVLNMKQRRNRDCILYDAIDTKDQEKPKVIKVLHTENEDASNRFKLGARVLTEHWFTGIPRVDQDGYFLIRFPNDTIPTHCLVMEKIEGMDLQTWLESASYKPIDEKKAIDWLEQLANILSKLHQNNFYHRDIKPSNIMLRDRTNELVLIDLDAVRAITEASQDGRDITRIGTPGYQAPEQEDGHAVPQSDFYALGRTFVHLLTGKHPTDKDLRSKRPYKLNWKVHAQQLQIFGSFAGFIDKLMAWNPNDRPKDAQEIVQKLKEIKQRLELQKQVGELFSFNQLNQRLTFKNVFGAIVILIFLGVVYQAIMDESPTPQSTVISTPIKSPAFTLCKFSKGGTVRDDNKLAKDVQDYLKLKIVATEDIELKQVNLYKVNQSNCDIIIIVKLNDQNALNSNLENKIRELIKNKFDYVGNITIAPPQ